jgi:hypothetical protein
MSEQNLEYYEMSSLLIDKALKDWDLILEKALLDVKTHQEGSEIMKYETDYKSYLSTYRDDLFLFNSLSTFTQIISIFNFHHQYNLLKSSSLMCICDEHNIDMFKLPYVCELDNQPLSFEDSKRDNYDYLGFIKNILPCGKFVKK